MTDGPRRNDGSRKHGAGHAASCCPRNNASLSPRGFFPSCPANRRQLRLAGPIAGLFIHTRFTVEGLKVVLKGGICNMSQGGVHE